MSDLGGWAANPDNVTSAEAPVGPWEKTSHTRVSARSCSGTLTPYLSVISVLQRCPKCKDGFGKGVRGEEASGSE